MAYEGPYPVVLGGYTSAVVISATTFGGGVINSGAIGFGGISLISGAFLSGGSFSDPGLVLGGIKVDSGSRIVASGTTPARRVDDAAGKAIQAFGKNGRADR
jgi:hypothetical protein